MSLGAYSGALMQARPLRGYQMVALAGDARTKQIVQAVGVRLVVKWALIRALPP